MASRNDVTNDLLISKTLSDEGAANWDKIFGVKKKEKYIPPPLPDDMYELEEKLDKKLNGY